MKFLNVLVLAASVSALTLDPRHHKGKKAGAAAKTNTTARAIDTAGEVVEHVAREFAKLAERHHKGKATKASKNKNNATARSVDADDVPEARSLPVTLDLEDRDIEARHHKGKATKAAKNKTNTTAAATARYVDTEAKAPVDLVGRAFVA